MTREIMPRCSRYPVGMAVATLTCLLLGSCGTAPTENVLQPLAAETSIPEELSTPRGATDANPTFEVFVTDCVEFVPFRAVTGDPAAQELWARVGQSTASLTVECQVIAVNPSEREALQDQMTQLDQFFAAAAAADGTSTTAPVLLSQS